MKVEVKEFNVNDMILMPPAKDVCQVCAHKHDPEEPHNKASLYYQMKFQMENGRPATWVDALAHCSDITKKMWIAALKEHGVEVDG